MSDFVDQVLGVTSGFSCLLSYVFYKLYTNRTETAKQVKNIRVWEPGEDLLNHLSQEGNLGYAAVEGVVKEIGRHLSSHHGNEKGVILHSQLTEHKSERTNGFWHDRKKVLRDSTEYVPFAVVPARGGASSPHRVEILEPGQAARLLDELDTTYEHFEPNKSNLVQIGLDRLFGEVTKGLQESEKMLLTGTSLLGVGRVWLERGQVKMGPPEGKGHTYILTKMHLRELVRHYEAQSAVYRIVAIVSAVVGGGLISVLLWRRARLWWERRKQRQQFDNIRRSMAEAAERRRARSTAEARAGNTAAGADREEGGVAEESACIVCLTNPREVVAISCGHISMCADCAQALPLPKKCPVCRAPVERFLPVFHP